MHRREAARVGGIQMHGVVRSKAEGTVMRQDAEGAIAIQEQ